MPVSLVSSGTGSFHLDYPLPSRPLLTGFNTVSKRELINTTRVAIT